MPHTQRQQLGAQFTCFTSVTANAPLLVQRVVLCAQAEVGLIAPQRERVPVRDQHPEANVKLLLVERQAVFDILLRYRSMRQHTSACVGIRQHASA